MVMRRLQRRPHLLSTAAWALTSILFLGYWLPQAFSAIDAIDPSASWTKAAAGLRYLPFMWLVAIAVATPERRRLTFGGLALITAAWTLDALVQALAGTSPWFWSLEHLKLAVSGHALCPADEAALADRLSGALCPCNLKFGQVLASLSPFLLLPMARRFGSAGWLLAAAALGCVLLLAGSRASWITFVLVLAYSGVRQFGWKRLLLLALVAALGSAALTAGVPQLRERVARTAQVWNEDGQGVDEALSGRARIWKAAVCMIEEHPVNGVGARGFRDAYPACVADEGPAVWGNQPALHAHQIVLEILAETGVLGLLLWLAAARTAGWLLSGMLLAGLLGTALTQGLIAYTAAMAPAAQRGRVVGVVQGGVFIGLLLAVDRLLDMTRTAVNVFSDSCGAVVIAKSEGETLKV